MFWIGFRSKKRYFDGVRVQVPATSDGIPVEFAILPGACADLKGLAELAFELPDAAQAFVDAGYNFYEWEDDLQEIENIKWQVPRKANSKRGREPWLEWHESFIRKNVETTIGETEKMFPKKRQATNLNGDVLKNALFLFAFQIDKAFIR